MQLCVMMCVVCVISTGFWISVTAFEVMYPKLNRTSKVNQIIFPDAAQVTFFNGIIKRGSALKIMLGIVKPVLLLDGN